jgi:hypothetical protein
MRIRFSATSLQEYIECPRRFQLRYVLDAPWPALATAAPSDQEEHLRLGHRLHHLIHQHFLGLAVESSPMPGESLLPQWWEAFLSFAAEWRGWYVAPEVALTIPIAGQRLAVRYDALAWPAQTGEDATPTCVILEWKTYSHPPQRDRLLSRMQSRVYPWALLAAGWAPPGCEISIPPDGVEMHYWLAGSPARVERFVYSGSALRTDGAYLETLIAGIAQRVETTSPKARGTTAATSAQAAEPWELTERRQLCEVCVYRSLCGRGARAGSVGDLLENDDDADDLQAAENDHVSGWSQIQETVF